MPKNPEQVIKDAAMAKDIAQDRAMDKMLELSHNVRMPSKDSKMYHLLKEIYMVFEPYITAPNLKKPIKALPSSRFDYLRDEHSPPTIIKAKKLLGIRSQRRGDKWYWRLPLRAPDESWTKLHEKQLEALNPYIEDMNRVRPSGTILMDFMKEHNYDVDARDAKLYMINCHYSYSSIMKQKSALGIASIKKNKEWRWVTGPIEVQDWLHNRLADGPVIQDIVLQEALKDKGWTAEVIRMARIASGGIRFTVLEGRVHLYDLNYSASTEPQETPKVMPVPAEDPDIPVKDRKIEKVKGINISTFE